MHSSLEDLRAFFASGLDGVRTSCDLTLPQRHTSEIFSQLLAIEL